MTVFITGGTGLLGARLVQELTGEGVACRLLARSEVTHPLLDGLGFEVVRGDLSDINVLTEAMAGCDRVYHIAGVISYDRRDTERMHIGNVIGTENVIRAARAAGVRRVVVTSSTSSVGLGGEPGAGLDEQTVWNPAWDRIPYLRTKREAEQRALALSAPSCEVVAVCPTTIYGGGDVKRNTGVVFEKIARGKLRIAPPGGSSVVSVSDTVTGHRLAMGHGRPGERYILATEDRTLLALFQEIANVLGVEAPRRTLPAFLGPPARWALGTARLLGLPLLPPDVVRIGFANRYFDASKAREELGWQPRQSAREMLAEAADFYRQHGGL